MSGEILSAWLDGELTVDERKTVDRSLAHDATLRSQLDELDQTRNMVRGLGVQEPPAGFLAALLEAPGAPEQVLDLDAMRHRRARRLTSAVTGIAAAAAIVIAIIVPSTDRIAPTLATDVRIHQAGVAAGGDPVSGLAPVASPLRFGR